LKSPRKYLHLSVYPQKKLYTDHKTAQMDETAASTLYIDILTTE